MALLSDYELLVAELSINAFVACKDFKKYAQGAALDDISFAGKDVALTHFLYPLLQATGNDLEKKGKIMAEIERLQQQMGGN